MILKKFKTFSIVDGGGEGTKGGVKLFGGGI